MSHKTLKNIDLGGLHETYEVNKQINELKKKFKELKSPLIGQTVILNSNDGNWVEAKIKTFYYNALGNGKEQIKLFVTIDDDYYEYNFRALFSSDMFGYITLDKILDWSSKYNNGVEAQILFENIKVGNTCFIYNDNKLIEVNINNISRAEDNHLKIHTSKIKKNNALLSLIKNTETEFELDILDYLKYQDRHRKENIDLYPSRGYSISMD